MKIISSRLHWVGLCLLLLGGCGEEDSKVPIEGIVFSDGKPLAGASVAFIGDEGGAFSSATTDEKGSFKMRAAPGKNKVAVNKIDTEKLPPVDPNADQTMPTDGEYVKMVKSAPKSMVAARFADPEKSGIAVDVSAGMSPIDINVMSK